MEIRLFQQVDYEAAYQLWVNTPGMGLNTTDDSRDGVLRYLRRNPNSCFVAEEAGEVVGVILAGHDGRRGFIYHLAVSVSHRNKGIGNTLVEHAMKALGQEGIHKVALVVMAGNETGNAFWEALGFTTREDLIYRNKNLSELVRIDT